MKNGKTGAVETCFRRDRGRSLGLYLRSLLVVGLLWWGGCASPIKSVAPLLDSALRAEAGVITALADVDEQTLANAKTKEEVEAWRKRYDSIRAALGLFHDSLTAITSLLLGGKK